ncbi:MAG: primosomal protein N' [Anaerolineales bacterium]|nr:MAG: primosomal protein N' [Anaerolineales bacterium]
MKNGAFAEVVPLATVSSGDPAPARAGFTYSVPDSLLGRVGAGSLVVVPFGTRRLYGVVVGLRPESSVEGIRPVESLVDAEPVLDEAHISLACWMSREYLAPLHKCMQAMLPPGIIGHADVVVESKPDTPEAAARTETQASLLAVLDRRGALRGRQLDRALRGIDWRPAARQLDRRGVVDRRSVLAPPRARTHRVLMARLTIDADARETLDGLRSQVYPAIVEFLRSEEGPVDVSWVYAETGCTRYHLDKLAERGAVVLESEDVWRDSLAGQVFVPASAPVLTSDQQAVWETIENALASPAADRKPFLLHGVTGSGKTEIYLRAVADVLSRGQSAIGLVPEISLTPQAVARFGARFPGSVAILHSALSAGERYDTWRRARAGLVQVVVGPRSALFAPLSPLGLIVVDEEHVESYKQEAPRPRYHVRDAAQQLAHLTGALVIFGSATPSLEVYDASTRGEFTRLQMPRRVMGHARRLRDLQALHGVSENRYESIPGGPEEARYMPLPEVEIVDLRAELRAGNRSIFSRALQRAVDDALGRDQQAILFLNRRGKSTFVLCRDCGHALLCPNCDTPLTYHSSQSRLVCHHCNHREVQPDRCPECGSERIRLFGLGTEGVEAAVRERWPKARLLRWDRDTARTHQAHAGILQRFAEGAADILIGTQMIAKGLDMPLVTVVGVISADTTLNLPDFRSAERTFQLMAQVAGRAGRGLRGGRVVVQTYHPDHFAIVKAADHDYSGFADRELAFRREQGYPPYCRLVKLIYEDESAGKVRSEAESLATVLRDALAAEGSPESGLIGSAPPFFQRMRRRHRWQILLRHPDPAALLGSVEMAAGWRVDVDPVSVL